MKKVTVTSTTWKMTIDVDEKIFDDYRLEACTQALEKVIVWQIGPLYMTKPIFNITHKIVCF